MKHVEKRFFVALIINLCVAPFIWVVTREALEGGSILSLWENKNWTIRLVSSYFWLFVPVGGSTAIGFVLFELIKNKGWIRNKIQWYACGAGAGISFGALWSTVITTASMPLWILSGVITGFLCGLIMAVLLSGAGLYGRGAQQPAEAGR